uniref:Uncharacterized protein n=1 Tax=Avena sativa TaxID=4498 RepID=A0ACD6AG50_AVESA
MYRSVLVKRAYGSKILVTTRTELVAKMLESKSSFFLQGLGRDDSWLLFKQHAFGRRNPEDFPELKTVGDQIVQKLKGSALALKVIGGHLNGKYSDVEWKHVLHKNVLNSDDILAILRLSYESLPEHLQQCFAYCSLFPKGYRIDLNRLVRMWIAQGFVHPDGNINRSFEDIGRGYFNDLLARSFFQVLRRGYQTYYVMHDSMNDLALHVSQGECSRVDHGSTEILPRNIRHLSVSAEQLGNLVNTDYIRRLREFLVDEEEQSLVQLKDLNKISGELSVRFLENVKNREEAAKSHLDLKEHISKLELEWGSCDGAHDMDKCFEVLDALKPHRNLEELNISGYPGVKSPSWLESDWLRRLEFICLRDCNRWEVLPPLGDLPLLRTLEVRRMDELKALGQEFFGRIGFPSLERFLLERLPKLEWCLVDNDQVLQNLRHLSVASCPRLRAYPTHPRTLRHIAVLDKERINLKARMDSCDLSRSFCFMVSSSLHVLHAHHLEFVEDMEIYVNHVVQTSRRIFSELKSLKRLKIHGSKRANTGSVIAKLWDENGDTVLPSSLKLFELRRCYVQPSSFFKLLNNLSSLDALRLSDCDTVEVPGPPAIRSHLRMLKRLNISNCDWISSIEGSEALLSLEEMTIYRCYDLETVPYLDDMPCLQKLHLTCCPQVMHLSKAGHQTALKELVVSHCDGLSSLQKLCDLVSLVELSVTDCSDLLCIPDMVAFMRFGFSELFGAPC